MTRESEDGGSRRSGGNTTGGGSQLRRIQSNSPLRQNSNEGEETPTLHGLGIEGGEPGPVDGNRVDNNGTSPTAVQDGDAMLDVPVSPVTRRGSQARVRFSTDLERGPASSPLSGSDVPPQTSDTRDRRPASRGLTVDTSVAASRANPPSNSPPEEGSNSSSPPLSAVPPLSSQDNAPAQSKSRNRGYSLRRALFFKNIQTQAEDEDSVEMDRHPSSGEESKPDTTLEETTTEEPDKIEAPTTNVTSTSQDDYSDSSDLKGSTSYSLPSSHKRWVKRRSATRASLLEQFKNNTEKARKFIFRVKDIPPSKNGRHIDLDASRKEDLIDERTGQSYIGNTIRSSRYSLWSFFPRQFVAQFSKLANFYFLVISILQMIPGLSTTGTFTTLIPLMIFVGISMGKEGFDDLRRYRLDKEENNRIARVLRPNGDAGSTGATEDDSESSSEEPRLWASVKWKDIKVGDVIKISRDQPVPADIALLHANGDNDVAYIETMALDGETNLKSKQPCRPVAKSCATVDDIVHNDSLHFVVEDPNIDLYKFDGNVKVGDEKLPLTNNEVIYRGSTLRNTPSAIGMVIYSGEECKIRMNANKNPRIKSPAIQSMVNRVVMVIVLFVVVLASVCTIAYKFWSQNTEANSWYLEDADVSYGPIFTSFLIMYNTMIPISLYVSLEIVKVAQMFLLNDIDMYDPESDTPMEARTSTINEELGQVSYIFSDKTGTLTNNSMRFRKMSVAGTAWFHDSDLREEASREGGREKLLHKKRSAKGKKAASRKSNVEDPSRRGSRKSNVSNSPQEQTVTSPTTPQAPNKGAPYRGENTSKMLEYIQQKPYTAFARKARFFILAMALCHTCVPEYGEDGDITYQAASPDELALVIAAKELGYLVVDRKSNLLTIQTFPNGPDEDPIRETYEILDVIEFSSARKRMSAVVRMPDQRICIFSKGADSTLMQLLRRSSLAADKIQDIERKASKRKAMEAMEAMRRNSEQRQTRKSIGGRTSLSIGRPSLGGHRRSSVSGKKVSMRDSVDTWLRDRETDVSAVPRDDGGAYSPRPSAQFARRQSSAFSDGGNSLQGDDDEAEDLVEESLVLNEALVFERCFQHLNDFATEGLRTLLYGYRFMDEAEYEEWKQAYHDATTSLVDRQMKIETVGEQVETDLELIGATAIEDKLQKGVPEAIEKLRRANIKLWMLTGDKRETAINIGHSCRLVKDYSTVIVLDHEVGDVDQVVTSSVQNIMKGGVPHSVVVVDGQTLSSIEADDTLKEHFFDLAILADSVICCRASPKQKAFLVRSIRKRVKKSITLAIGDGANDIAMIQEAHVGIGITGKEGLQAARISDYSIAQFRFLLKLLLVHGRWNYLRVCKYTLGTFWKETLFYLTQALFQRWNGYTGTSLYEQWSLSMFNTLFTSLPVIFLGIFEKDLAASTLLAVPELYTKGQQHAGFNIKLYLGWAFMATCEAMVVYFTMLGLFGETIFSKDQGIFAMGFLSFSASVIIINMKLQFLEIRNKSIMAAISIFLSVGGWFLWNIILSRRYVDNVIYNVKDNFLTRSGRDLLWWVTLLLCVMAVILFEITVSTIRSTIFPTDVDTFQEYEQDREIRKRFEEAAADELQLGWNRGDKKSSFELANQQQKAADDNGDRDTEPDNATQAEREKQVQDLLDRPRVMDKRRDSSSLMKSTKDKLRRIRSGDRQSSTSRDDDLQRAEEGEMEEVEVELTRMSDSGGGVESASGAEAPRRRSADIQVLLSRGFGSVRKGQELK